MYDVDAELTRLYGEFDDNFLAVARNGDRQIWKIMHVDCQEQRVDMQCQAMSFLVKSGIELNIPIVIPTSAGQAFAVVDVDGVDRLVWLLRYCEGTLLENIAPHTDELTRSFGRTMGLLDLGLRPFTHPAMRSGHEWELTRAGATRCYVQHVADGIAGLVDEALQRFESETAGKLGDLPHSVIHNDANDGNVLVNVREDGCAEVDGIIDFGDISYQPTVCDVAIALAYVVINKDDPLSACARFLEGYSRINPLNDDELAVLHPLIMTRLAVSIAIAAGRRSRNPDDPVGRQDKRPAMRALAQLGDIPCRQAERLYRKVCAGNMI